MMRYVLYALTIAVFILKEYFSIKYPELSFRLYNYFLVLFVILCIDFAVRLRKSLYLFYPISYGVALLLNFIQIPGLNISNVLLTLINLLLGVILIKRALELKKEGNLRVGFSIGAVGLLTLILGLRIFGYIFEELNTVIQAVYGGPILYIILVLVAATAFALPAIRNKYIKERELFLFLIILSLIPLLAFILISVRA